MELKINTNPTYTLIKPISLPANVNMTEVVYQKWLELTTSDSRNLILDMQACQSADPQQLADQLFALHEIFYKNNNSFVIVNLPAEIYKVLKKLDEDMTLNITPTLAEAVDIIQMEMLERDLLNEDGEEF
jgi:anti-anti-sigma regulatory factor